MTTETTTGGDLVDCDACNTFILEDQIDDDGLCPACAAEKAAEDTAHAYTCDECGYELDDRSMPKHTVHTTCCATCGEDRETVKARDTFEELAERIINTDDLLTYRKAIAALRRIAK